MAKAGKKKKPISVAPIAMGARCLKIEMVEVDDPYTLKPGAKIIVARNLTPLADLFKKGKIDNSQRIAGERFAHMYEHAELGGAKAIDYTREHVDGGGISDPLSAQQQEALDWLRCVIRYPGIGKHGFSVLRAVCGEGRSIPAFAKQIGMRNGAGYGIRARARAEEGYVQIRLIEALDCLVDYLGLNAKGSDRGRMRSEQGDNMAGDGSEYEINQIGDFVLHKRA